MYDLHKSFDYNKAAHIAAYFLLKEDGAMEILKLMKLIYLSERESFNQTDESMVHDKMVSMPNGPVLSGTLDIIKKKVKNTEWEYLYQGREGDTIRIKPGTKYEDLEELSDSDVDIIEKVYEDFGHYSSVALRNMTHLESIIPEWEDPEGSSKHINLGNMLKSLGKSNASIREIRKKYLDNKNLIHSLEK